MLLFFHIVFTALANLAQGTLEYSTSSQSSAILYNFGIGKCNRPEKIRYPPALLRFYKENRYKLENGRTWTPFMYRAVTEKETGITGRRRVAS
jgi:hypothetical protein